MSHLSRLKHELVVKAIGYRNPLQLASISFIRWNLANSKEPGSVNSGVCELCHTVLFSLKHRFLQCIQKQTPSINYGSIDEILSRKDCPFCQFIGRSLSLLPLDQRNGLTSVALIQGCWIRVNCKDRSEVCVSYNGVTLFSTRILIDRLVHIGSKCRALPHGPGWRVFQKGYHPPLRGGRYAVDDDCSVIERSFLRLILHRCNDIVEMIDIDLFLIDVLERRLVRLPSSVRYVTLSYVWGNARVLCTTRQNRVELFEYASLTRNRPAVVVEDAMEVVRALGERYLWVDSLCIIQDEDDFKGYYIDKMDFIYSGSLFTIVAASGKDAMSPLPGIRPGTRGPQVSQKFRGLRLLKDPASIEHTLAASVYDSRGWTFQERVLSRHCLVFTDEQVLVQKLCSEAAYTISELPDERRRLERTEYVSEPLKGLQSKKAYIRSSYCESHRGLVDDDPVEPGCTNFGGILTYRNIISSYTKKNLTYDSDVLRAIAGIMSYLESKMPHGRIIFGVPTVDLSLALSWIHARPASRRLSCESPIGRERLALPSWSWAGWTGRKEWTTPLRDLDARSLRHEWTYKGRVRNVEVGDGTTWYPLESEGCRDQSWTAQGNILRFSAAIIKAAEFKYRPYVKPASKKASRGWKFDCLAAEVMRVEFGEERPCGIVYGLDHSQMESASNYAFVVLGEWKEKVHWAYSNLGKYPVDYDFSGHDKRKGAQFHTYMIVEWSDTTEVLAERVGLTHIHSEILPWWRERDATRSIQLA